MKGQYVFSSNTIDWIRLNLIRGRIFMSPFSNFLNRQKLQKYCKFICWNFVTRIISVFLLIDYCSAFGFTLATSTTPEDGKLFTKINTVASGQIADAIAQIKEGSYWNLLLMGSYCTVITLELILRSKD